MLIICDSINQKELKVLEDYFPESKLIKSGKKVKDGIGKEIKGSTIKNSKLIKLNLTSKQGDGRVVFLVVIKKKFYIPVILKLKKDKIIGNNMTIKNKKFQQLLNTNLDLIFDDIKNKRYKKYKLD